MLARNAHCMYHSDCVNDVVDTNQEMVLNHTTQKNQGRYHCPSLMVPSSTQMLIRYVIIHTFLYLEVEVERAMVALG
jgi:hypothetical protein